LLWAGLGGCCRDVGPGAGLGYSRDRERFRRGVCIRKADVFAVRVGGKTDSQPSIGPRMGKFWS